MLSKSNSLRWDGPNEQRNTTLCSKVAVAVAVAVGDTLIADIRLKKAKATAGVKSRQTVNGT